jgi:multidrug efflux pump
VVRARDLATIRSTFKDAETITRLNGKPAIAIEVSKRTGANLIETVDAVKVVANDFKALLPAGAESGFSQDKSTSIRQLLSDLQNSVLTAVILVFIVILYALSGRASLLIGFAIPASFLMGILALSLAGLTVNIVVLFSLILAVGMLVDDAIIVTEFAERRMSEGMHRKEAFSLAAKRMAGPVVAATLTRVAAFSPLLVLARHGRRVHEIHADHADCDALGIAALRSGFHPDARRDVRQADGRRRPQARRALHALRRRGQCGTRSSLFSSPLRHWSRCRWPTANTARGSSSSPMSSRITALLYVHARGNLSLDEKDARFAWSRTADLGWPGLTSVYTRVGNVGGGGNDVAEDVVGVIQYEFVDWRERKPAGEILDDFRRELTGIPGRRYRGSGAGGRSADRQGDPDPACRQSIRPG